MKGFIVVVNNDYETSYRFVGADMRKLADRAMKLVPEFATKQVGQFFGRCIETPPLADCSECVEGKHEWCVVRIQVNAEIL